VASPAEQDRVRELQRTLYRAAKADPGRRFHALYDKVYRRDVLERAWAQVRANRGAAGIDRITLAAVEQYGVGRLLDELAVDLKEGSTVRFPRAGSSFRSPDGRSGGRSRSRRCATGSCKRRSRSSSALGGRDGHRQLLRGDPVRTVDAGDRGTDRRPPDPQTLRVLLRAGVMEEGAVRRSVSGTPQGGS
jgi:hypothetical protein